MSGRKANKANAVFRKTKSKLKPWEQTALETVRKTERLKALRLARDAENAAIAAAGIVDATAGKA